MTKFTKEYIEKQREQIKFISPLPWTACSCGKCGSISNETDAIAKATMGNWGDDYPDIRRIGGSIEGKFETFMNQITYGNIPKETGNINAQYIADACNNYPEALDHIERLQQRIAELEQERRWIHQDNTMIVKKDGNAWCFVLPDFIDLQQSETYWSGDPVSIHSLDRFLSDVYERLSLPQPPKERE